MRTISGTTPAGVGETYIPVNRYSDVTNVQVIVTGTVTFTVDWTLDNIRVGAGSAVNLPANGVDAASANWTNLIASGSATAAGQAAFPVDSLRVNITAGTGTVSYRITQEP